jgi:hypothetical protein
MSKLYAGFQLFLMGDGPDLNKIQDSITGFQLEGYVTICLLAIRLILFRMLDLRF